MSMNIEIWSDVMCPFCYIGKRRLEGALEEFTRKEDVRIIWKSFQLDPTTVTNPALNTIENLAHKKGWSKEQTYEAMGNVVNMAAQVGLDFDFEKAVVANSFNAHRMSHLAKKYGKQNELEELLFAAYFTEGKNTDDTQTLLALSARIGLDEAEVMDVLKGTKYTEEVRQDIAEAQQIGVRGVPFFVFDRKYVISGAQSTDTFLQTLQQSYDEQAKLNVVETANTSQGGQCGPESCEVKG